jgi:4-diphosphocytidyl-2-C-methyl-D-erythritol kinase
LYVAYKELLPILRRDLRKVREMAYGAESTRGSAETKLTEMMASDTINELGRSLSARLSELYSGAPFGFTEERGRAENPLLWLVRAGIKNDFEQVVFPEYPELVAAKSALERAGAQYASLSGSGSALYGLFASRQIALKAASKLQKQGWAAQATATVTRQAYWKRLVG